MNDWRQLRENAQLGLRETARRAKISPTFLSRLEKGLDKMPAKLAVILGDIYNSQVVLAHWYADTYDAREFLECRFVNHPEYGFDFEYFDPGDKDEYPWVADGDAHHFVKQGFYQSLCNLTQ